MTKITMVLAAAFPKYRIPLHTVDPLELLTTHSALAMGDLPEIRVYLTLATKSAVVAGSDPSKIGGYQLSEIEIEYTTLRLDDATAYLPPPSRLVFNHIVHHAMTPFNWATDTLLSDTVQVQCQSFVGIPSICCATSSGSP